MATVPDALRKRHFHESWTVAPAKTGWGLFLSVCERKDSGDGRFLELKQQAGNNAFEVPRYPINGCIPAEPVGEAFYFFVQGENPRSVGTAFFAGSGAKFSCLLNLRGAGHFF